MALSGTVTQLLKPQYQREGYSLNKDEDFIYLYLDGKEIACFSSPRNSLEAIEKYIEACIQTANLEDFWKHAGHED